MKERSKRKISHAGDRPVPREATPPPERAQAGPCSPQEVLRTVLDAVPLSIFWKDKDLNYLGCNRTFALGAGLESPADVVGKNDFDLGSADLARRIREEDLEILSTLAPRETYRELKGPSNGNGRWVRVRKIPFTDPDGKAGGIVGTHESVAGDGHPPVLPESQFRHCVEASPVPMIISDKDQRPVFVNRKFEELFGLPANECSALEMLWPPATPGDDAGKALRQSCCDHIAAALARHEEVAPLELAVTCRDGSTRHIECRLASINDTSLVVCNDLTEFRRTQEELANATEKLKVWVFELEEHNRRMMLLHKMGNALRMCIRDDDAYGVIRQYGPQLFPKSTGALYDLSETTESSEPVLKWGKRNQNDIIPVPRECPALWDGQIQEKRPLGSGCPCIRKAMPGVESGQLGGKGPSEPECSNIREAVADGRSLCLPMMVSGRPQGLMRLILHERSEDEDGIRELALVVTEHIALSLTNLRLHESLRIQAIRDPLTGLYNRRYMEESLEREFYRSSRGQYPLSILMLDLDHFKRINDGYGHDAGDLMLKDVARIIQDQVRKEDIACRFGGEEFVLILPYTNLVVAARRAEELRRKMSETSFDRQCPGFGALTISVGVAAFPDHGQDTETVLRMADRALYRAKEKGRNQVETA